MNKFDYQHHRDVVDIFISLLLTGEDFEWTQEHVVGDLRCDAKLKMFGKTFYIEVERGTQGIPVVEKKINNYCKIPGSFHVIFTFQDYEKPISGRKVLAKDIGGKALDLLEEYRKGNQFVVTEHNLFVKYPLSPYLMSPTGGDYSLSTID